MKLNLVLRGNKWYASGTLPTLGRVYKSTGFEKQFKQQAYEWCLNFELENLNGKPTKPEYEDQPFKNLADKYILSKPHMSDKECNAINVMLRYLSDKTVRDVRTNLDEYIYTRHANSKLNTICRDVDRRIRAIINYGRKQNWCGSFEVDCSEFRVDDTRTRFIDRETALKLIDAMPNQDYKDFESILQFQGLRFGQARGLTKASLVGDELITSTGKGMLNGLRREVHLPLFPQARKILERRIKHTQHNELFASIKYSTFRYNRIKACEKIGLADYRIHDNRSMFITDVGQILSLTTKEAASLLGQDSEQYVKRYWQERDLRSRIKQFM